MSDSAQARERFAEQLRQYHAKVSGWVKSAWRAPTDDDFETSEDYRNALQFWRDFEKKDGVDYTTVVAYAKEAYERTEKTDRLLDEKADSIVKYLGGGSALVTFGTLVSVKPDKPETSLLGVAVIVSLAPSLVLAVCAVVTAIAVRKPRSAAVPPDVVLAVNVAEHYKEKSDIEVNLGLVYHPIIEAARFRNTRKSHLVARAHRLYLWSIGALFLPLVVLAVALSVLAAR